MPVPPSPDDHDPIEWVWGMGRLNESRWRSSWSELFETHDLLGSIQGDLRHLVDALELAASGKVRAHVEVYRLSAVNEVLDRLATGRVRYRAVLTPP